MGILSGALGFVLDLMSDPTRDEMHTREANGWERYHELRQIQQAQKAALRTVNDDRKKAIAELAVALDANVTLRAELEKSVAQLMTVAALRNGGVEAIGVGIVLERAKKECAAARADRTQAIDEVNRMAAKLGDAIEERNAAHEETRLQERKYDAWAVVRNKDVHDAIEAKARAEKERDAAIFSRDMALRAREGSDLSWNAMKAQRDEARGKTIEAVGLMTEASEERDAAIEARDLAVKKYDLYREQIRTAGEKINPLLEAGHKRIADLVEDNSRLTHATDTLADFVYYVVIETALAAEAPSRPPTRRAVVKRACAHYCEACRIGGVCVAAKSSPHCMSCGGEFA